MTITKLASSAHGSARTARGSTPGTAGESSSGQCAAAHGRPRAVCNPATVASVQPGRRGAVQHTGLQQTERKRAMVSAHARAHTRTAGTPGIPWMFCMFCMFCMHCSTRPSAGTFQPRNSARAHQHGHIYTHGGRGQVLRLLLLFMLLPQRSAGIPLPYCLHVLHACMVAALFRVECSLCTLIVSGCSV